ncbi:MAG: hypothetical protein AXA67_04825 [Methylothermaceae bacteria B42]|nr:MAG: hypothetical protein AXA67_04825 [Methylothermaceae bacteria B42]HHJ40011.1 hypothetical protein [Methylothermaceae bacterium]
MRIFKLFTVTVLLLGLVVFLPACAMKKADRRHQDSRYQVAGGYSPNYESYDLDELIDYMGYLNRLPLLQRNAECQWLHRFNAIDSSLGVKIHLAYALLSTLECGDSKEAANLLESAALSVDDEQIQGFLSYQQALAQRLFACDLHAKELEQKLKLWKIKNQKLENNYKICGQNLKIVKEKLEALKEIEESLNHTEAQ